MAGKMTVRRYEGSKADTAADKAAVKKMNAKKGKK